jgi:hypothetical protein
LRLGPNSIAPAINARWNSKQTSHVSASAAYKASHSSPVTPSTTSSESGGSGQARSTAFSTGQIWSLCAGSRSKVGTLKTYDQRYSWAARSLTALPRRNHALS